MSATTVNHALMSLGFGSASVTAHDFRATASTRLHEMGLRSDFTELQLAHVERNRVRAAYNHADHLAELDPGASRPRAEGSSGLLVAYVYTRRLESAARMRSGVRCRTSGSPTRW